MGDARPNVEECIDPLDDELDQELQKVRDAILLSEDKRESQ